MTSSSCYELKLRQGGTTLAAVTAKAFGPPGQAAAEQALDARRPVDLLLTRPEGLQSRGRVLVGEQVELVVQPGQAEARATITSLRFEFGEVAVEYVEADPDGGSGEVLLRLLLVVEADPALLRLHELLVEQLEAIHVGLARDVLARTAHRWALHRDAVKLLRPEDEAQRLQALLGRLTGALERIGGQPSQAMVRQVARQRFRAGDRVVMAAVTDTLRDRATVVEGRRLRAIGRVPIRHAQMTLDIAEHRWLREGLLRLAGRARALEGHCRRAAAALATDLGRFSGAIYQEHTLPRIARYDALGERARELRARFARLVREHPFVAAAGASRSRLRPTPIFHNRPGYREAYAALREADSGAGLLVAGEDLRVRFRSLPKLYEYWCYLTVVKLLTTLVGPPRPGERFAVIDEIYRPDLQPGQSFHFPLQREAELTVTYEPDVPPLGQAARAEDRARSRYRAALSSAPLRPDVVVELRDPPHRPALLVLDAKCTERFAREDLWAYTDYRLRILDPESGHQPVRQVFFVHRDLDNPLLENLPGYLDGERGDRDSALLGAVACVPEDTARLARVLQRFLEVQRW